MCAHAESRREKDRWQHEARTEQCIYSDDIYVDVTKVGATRVKEHLRRFYQEAKQPEML